MVVANNVAALNTNRQLKIIMDGKKKATEKLSSGYRINRSADDAAGLSISEKMRWQIRGLDKGMQNIGDGISLIDVADGAMQEIHNILQRVRELSVQAYNDTNTSSDRDAIQDEVNESLKEIDHIVDTTTFNTKPLLKGNPTITEKIGDDKTVDKIVERTTFSTVPSWLKVDSNLQTHSGYTSQLGNYSQVQNNMITDLPTKTYYGDQNNAIESQGYTYGGKWSDSIDDNANAKIDFSGLINNSSTGLDLYNNLMDLIGTKISFSCGTCTRKYNSIAFGGSEKYKTTKNLIMSLRCRQKL